MACNCSSRTAPNGYKITKADGSVLSFTNETEAAAASVRLGLPYTRA